MSQTNGPEMGYRITDEHSYGDKAVKVYAKSVLGDVPKMAGNLIERWGIVACESDGEDSAGRQKLKPMPTDKLVRLAFDAAEGWWKACVERGHVIAIPDLNEVNAASDAARIEKAAAKKDKQLA